MPRCSPPAAPPASWAYCSAPSCCPRASCPGCSLVEALTERYSRKFGFEYGQSRAWGSFGYAIVALIAGHTFNINPLINFWIGSACTLDRVFVYLFWVPAEQKAELKKEADSTERTNPSLKEMVSVLACRPCGCSSSS